VQAEREYDEPILRVLLFVSWLADTVTREQMAAFLARLYNSDTL